MDNHAYPLNPTNVEVSLAETETTVTFTFHERPNFASGAQLYNALRTILAEAYGQFILVRFASRVERPDFRLLSCPDRHTVYHDPLACLRDPVTEVNAGESFTLHILPFKPSYTRARSVTLRNHEIAPLVNAVQPIVVDVNLDTGPTNV
jgi:hypothetical protein